MNEFAGRAAHALAVYLERGRKALAALQAGNLDEAEELLRWRTAAFHNFRALDARALEAGTDLQLDAAVQATIAADADVRRDLEKVLTEVFAKTGRQLAKIREARHTLSNYRSQSEKRSRFESSV